MRSLLFLLFLPFAFALKLQAQANLCEGATLLCSKETIEVDPALSGPGVHLLLPACGDKPAELRSAKWFSWTIREAGSLTLEISAAEAGDDLDFILYQVSDPSLCTSAIPRRCMLSGRNTGSSRDNGAACIGDIGLDFSALEESAERGCDQRALRYLRYIETHVGESYALCVNNIHAAGAYTISFGGSCNFDSQLRGSSCQATTEQAELTADFMRIYPNPTATDTRIMIQSAQEGLARITLTDMQGQQLIGRHASISKGHNSINLPANTFPAAGIYLLELTIGDRHYKEKILRL